MVVCIGVPYMYGEPIPSDRNSLNLIKASGFMQEIDATWVDVEPNFTAYARPIDAVNVAIAETIQKYADHFPLVFANGCTDSLGVVGGIRKPNVGIIWYDAHGDFNTPETTPSGFLGGMPLAMLVGRGDLSYMEKVGLSPVAEAGVILTDARNLDPAESEAVKNSSITHLTSVSEVLKTVLPAKPLYVHVDTDVLDASVMPASKYAEPNGPSVEALVESLAYVAEHGDIAAATILTWDMTMTDNQEAMLDMMVKLANAVLPRGK